jgi:hypothetical protein
MLHFGRHHLEAIALKAADNLADHVLGDGIRFDNGKSALDSHVLLQKISKNVQKTM